MEYYVKKIYRAVRLQEAVANDRQGAQGEDVQPAEANAVGCDRQGAPGWVVQPDETR